MKKRKPAIIFVTETFLQYGGVETRVHMYAQAYRQKGWKVYIEPTRYRTPQKRFFNQLNRNCLKNTCLLAFWHFTRRVKIIEWQSGEDGRIKFYPLVLRLLGIKLGIVFHGNVGSRVLQKTKIFHYCICVSDVQKQRVPALHFCTTLSNTLPYREMPSWCWRRQRRALYISRLDPDKMPSVQAFISFCSRHHLQMDIAGQGYAADALAKQAAQLSGQADIRLIGAVKTPVFLQQHLADYLFVGGIGQVITEALLSGFPALLAPLTGEKYCFFVKGHNLPSLRFCNFSPHTVQECAGFAADIANASHDVRDLMAGLYPSGWLSAKQAFDGYDFATVFAQYWQLVNRNK